MGNEDERWGAMSSRIIHAVKPSKMAADQGTGAEREGSVVRAGGVWEFRYTVRSTQCTVRSTQYTEHINQSGGTP
jgi:hypothetical protein